MRQLPPAAFNVLHIPAALSIDAKGPITSAPRRPVSALELKQAARQILQRQNQQLTLRAHQDQVQCQARALAPRPPQSPSAPRNSVLVLEPRQAAGPILQRRNRHLTP